MDSNEAKRQHDTDEMETGSRQLAEAVMCLYNNFLKVGATPDLAEQWASEYMMGVIARSANDMGGGE